MVAMGAGAGMFLAGANELRHKNRELKQRHKQQEATADGAAFGGSGDAGSEAQGDQAGVRLQSD